MPCLVHNSVRSKCESAAPDATAAAAVPLTMAAALAAGSSGTSQGTSLHRRARQRVLRAVQRGMSLVEVLVAVAIGMIGILVITQAYITSDNFNRATLGEGGAQTNGTIALFTVEREIRMAGYGLNNTNLLGCGAVNWYYNGDYAQSMGGTLPNIIIAPVSITVTPGEPDRITVMYSSDSDRIVPTTLSKTMPSPSSELSVDGTVGFTPGDLVIMVNKTPPINCTLEQITQVQQVSAKLQHNPGITAPYNPPGAGLFPAYQTGDMVFNLGNPKVRTYSIVNNSLRLTDTLLSAAGGTPFDMVHGIVDLRAEYGKDDGIDNGTVPGTAFVANDGIVDNFSNAPLASGAEWQQVLALRIAVLTRISTYERPVAGACASTTAAPTWANGTRNFTVPEGLPSCYRYRAFETVVPVRNMIWRQD